jgi:hypothetical protein
MQFLVEERRRTVNEKTRQSNRLTDCLKRYFPHLLPTISSSVNPPK